MNQFLNLKNEKIILNNSIKDNILDRDLNEILNLKIEEDRNLIYLSVRNLNKITFIKDIKDYFKTYGNVISCEFEYKEDVKNNTKNAIIAIEDNDEMYHKIIKREHILNGSILTISLFNINNLNSHEKLNFKKTSVSNIEKNFFNKFKKIGKKESKSFSILTHDLKKENFSTEYFKLSNFYFQKEKVFADRHLNKMDEKYFLNKKRSADFISILSNKENFTNHEDFTLNDYCPGTPIFNNENYSRDDSNKVNFKQEKISEYKLIENNSHIY